MISVPKLPEIGTAKQYSIQISNADEGGEDMQNNLSKLKLISHSQNELKIQETEEEDHILPKIHHVKTQYSIKVKLDNEEETENENSTSPNFEIEPQLPQILIDKCQQTCYFEIHLAINQVNKVLQILWF